MFPSTGMMPQSPDAERAVLGAILINNHAFYRIIGTIDTETSPRRAPPIFATMRRMAERSPGRAAHAEGRAVQARPLEQSAASPTSLADGCRPRLATSGATRRSSRKSRCCAAYRDGNSVMLRARLPQRAERVLNIAEKSLYNRRRSTDKGFVSLERITRTNMPRSNRSLDPGPSSRTPHRLRPLNERRRGSTGDRSLAASPQCEDEPLYDIAETIALPGKDWHRAPETAVFGRLVRSKCRRSISRSISPRNRVSNHLILPACSRTQLAELAERPRGWPRERSSSTHARWPAGDGAKAAPED